MVYINNLNDVTLSSPGSGPLPAFQSALNNSSGKTFQEAVTKNLIYQGNGLICQQKMCTSLTGCDTKLGCPDHPDWKKVVAFCGPVGTPGLSVDGSYWVRHPADAQQKMFTATKQATGLQVLPNPYNVVGMY